jgi:hypothetical protein
VAKIRPQEIGNQSPGKSKIPPQPDAFFQCAQTRAKSAWRARAPFRKLRPS